MAVAKAKGRLRGKQPKLSPSQERHLVDLHRAGSHTGAELAKLFNVARSTVYRAVTRAGAPPTISIMASPEAEAAAAGEDARGERAGSPTGKLDQTHTPAPGHIVAGPGRTASTGSTIAGSRPARSGAGGWACNREADCAGGETVRCRGCAPQGWGCYGAGYGT